MKIQDLSRKKYLKTEFISGRVKHKQAIELIKYLEKHPKNENEEYPKIKEKLRKLKTDKHYNRGGG